MDNLLDLTHPLLKKEPQEHEYTCPSSKKQSKIFPCDECFQFFTNNYGLVVHKRTHTGEKPYECVVCNTKFSTKSNMISHHKRLHIQEKFYKCDMCDNKFFRNDDLKRHKTIHTGDIRTYGCEVCKINFKQLCNLRRHKSLCHGTGLYKCNECNKCFNSRKSMVFHTNTRH